MIDLIFPDGSKREFEPGTTGKQVAASIAPSLAKRAVLIKLDGELLDVDRPLDHGGKFEILDRNAPEALETIRHDVSHILAEAVQELFPGTQVTIGPAIED
ncbi:MAG TPA: TGS domain-containing protein, partial [Phenylobacterium sp.]